MVDGGERHGEASQMEIGFNAGEGLHPSGEEEGVFRVGGLGTPGDVGEGGPVGRHAGYGVKDGLGASV